MTTVPLSLSDTGAFTALADSVKYAYGAGVLGDIVEFGCFMGSTARVIAYIMSEAERQWVTPNKNHGVDGRKLWLFDSFEGLPKTDNPIDAQSPHMQAGAWNWQFIGDNRPTPELMWELCGRHLPPDKIEVVPGWYKDTLAQIPAGTRFAMVHIDCDLYESTYSVLDHLFGNDMISDGCALLFDDWYCNRGSPAFGEQKAWADINRLGIRFTDWGGYGPFGRKFIIHR